MPTQLTSRTPEQAMLESQDGVMAIWIGDFPTQKEFDAYVEEYEGKPSKKHPLSQFAREAGDEWYDHDFFTAWRFPKPKGVAGLLEGGLGGDDLHPR
jgi:hypothetical protein